MFLKFIFNYIFGSILDCCIIYTAEIRPCTGRDVRACVFDLLYLKMIIMTLWRNQNLSCSMKFDWNSWVRQPTAMTIYFCTFLCTECKGWKHIEYKLTKCVVNVSWFWGNNFFIEVSLCIQILWSPRTKLVVKKCK